MDWLISLAKTFYTAVSPHEHNLNIISPVLEKRIYPLHDASAAVSLQCWWAFHCLWL